MMTRYQFLAELHRVLQPRIYLEIGVQTGASLWEARAADIAYGIDPHPQLLPQFVAPNQRIIASTADEYFACTSCERPTIDLAFIDGSHLWEDALRDFVNIATHSHPGTVVVFDDVLPYSDAIAGREPLAGDWTGDVWKTANLLDQAVRGQYVDVSPTGAYVVWGDLAKAVSLTGVTRDFLAYADTYEPVPEWILDRRLATDPPSMIEELSRRVERGEIGCASR